MANTTITSANMGMPLPVAGQTSGPDYALDNSASLTIVDSHDHSSGKGVQITPAGINLNSDLSLQSNNLTTIRSSRYAVQPSLLSGGLDLACVYVSGVDFYFNDGNGNQIQITKDGSIAGTSGSIANLASPASASYVSANGTFVWQSDASKAANMDGGSVIIRKLTTSSPGITISAPSALSSNYTLTLPSTPPGSQQLLQMDASGNVTTTPQYTVDNSTIVAPSGVLQVPTGGITASQIASATITEAQMAPLSIGTPELIDGSVTAVKLAASNGSIGGSSGAFSTASTSYVQVTNLSLNITCTGARAVLVTINQAATGGGSITAAGGVGGTLLINNNVTGQLQAFSFGSGGVPTIGSTLSFVDLTPPSGTSSYSVYAKGTGAGSVFISNWRLSVVEL